MDNPREERETRDEVNHYLPEWVRILRDYLDKGREKYLQNKLKYESENEPRH